MARPAARQPTDVELQILRVLWQQKSLTARGIHDALSEIRDTNYSTTVKMLSLMLEKGLVKRDESVSPHLYRSSSSQQTTQRKIVKDLIQRVYDGSASSLVIQALSTKKSTPEELAAIQELLDDLKEQSE
jgi:predicted transcriptional regulator